MTRPLLLLPVLIAVLGVLAYAEHHEHTDSAHDAAGHAQSMEHAEHTGDTAAQPVEHAGHGSHADMHEMDDMAQHAMLVTHAVAVMRPTQGNTTYGVVWFEQLDEHRVKITAEISGLTPNAQHGFHVHEFGDVTSADGSACGGHYNPEGHDHALPTTGDARHAGDLGNLTADADGNADFGLIVDNLSLAGMHNPVVGRGLIIHANPDDGGQPTGNAGARIAQGVIGVTKAPGKP